MITPFKPNQDDDADVEWLRNPTTGRLREHLRKDESRALNALLSKAKNSSDPDVRGAYALYDAITEYRKAIEG